MKEDSGDLYFIVSQDNLGEYGNMDGSSLKEAQEFLEEETLETIQANKLVVIKGKIVPVRIQAAILL